MILIFYLSGDNIDLNDANIDLNDATIDMIDANFHLNNAKDLNTCVVYFFYFFCLGIINAIVFKYLRCVSLT